VIAVLVALSLYDSSNKKAQERARYVGEMPEPSFPVPALPAIKGLNEKGDE